MEFRQWTSDRSNCAAVLLSGGRDSFLAAGIAVEKGYSIVPVICDNGHMEGVERARYAVHWLQKVYGEGRVCDLCIRKTGMALLEYVQSVWRMHASELAKEYPDLQMYQAHCLACKTAMYVSVLKFCLQNSIPAMVDGVRRCQGFFVDHPVMHERYQILCSENKVSLLTPVYNLESDLERKRMLNERGLPTKTLEPQCFLGCPMLQPLSEQEIESLTQFYDREMKYHVTVDLSQAKG